MRYDLGHAEVSFTEVDGYLVAHAVGSCDTVWTCSRTSQDTLAAAVMLAARDGDGMVDRELDSVGRSRHSEAAAIKDFKRIENANRMLYNENAGLCHCGHGLYGSDHCPLCGCEQYESYCDTYYHDCPAAAALCGCPVHDN